MAAWAAWAAWGGWEAWGVMEGAGEEEEEEEEEVVTALEGLALSNYINIENVFWFFSSFLSVLYRRKQSLSIVPFLLC